mmetsp:Transcript_130725/g.279573  ORF Transcript_130725/g.279573 Transcript_130725/m.279573 type:complete len:201 (-) Transcript_130725:240-842(-)
MPPKISGKPPGAAAAVSAPSASSPARAASPAAAASPAFSAMAPPAACAASFTFSTTSAANAGSLAIATAATIASPAATWASSLMCFSTGSSAFPKLQTSGSSPDKAKRGAIWKRPDLAFLDAIDRPSTTTLHLFAWDRMRTNSARAAAPVPPLSFPETLDKTPPTAATGGGAASAAGAHRLAVAATPPGQRNSGARGLEM